MTPGNKTTAQYSERIIRDPQVCGGEPVFKGTRVPLRTVLASLAEGDTIEQILVDFPTLTADSEPQACSTEPGAGTPLKQH